MIRPGKCEFSHALTWQSATVAFCKAVTRTKIVTQWWELDPDGSLHAITANAAKVLCDKAADILRADAKKVADPVERTLRGVVGSGE